MVCLKQDNFNYTEALITKQITIYPVSRLWQQVKAEALGKLVWKE